MKKEEIQKRIIEIEDDVKGIKKTLENKNTPKIAIPNLRKALDKATSQLEQFKKELLEIKTVKTPIAKSKKKAVNEAKEQIKKKPKGRPSGSKSAKKETSTKSINTDKLSINDMKLIMKRDKQYVGWSNTCMKRQDYVDVLSGKYTIAELKAVKAKIKGKNLPDVKFIDVNKSDEKSVEKATDILDAEGYKVVVKKKRIVRKKRSENELNKEDIKQVISRKVKDLPEAKTKKIDENKLAKIVKDAVEAAIDKYINSL